jgi:hypothetical protein
MKINVALIAIAIFGLSAGTANAATPGFGMEENISLSTSVSSASTTLIGQSIQIKSETVSQRNAKNKAKSYLRYSSFSRKGLIEQLKFEGFNTKDATYGVDANKVNWNLQAVKKGKSYLSNSSFSRTGLIEQLVFEGFTKVQATYGVNKSNANWNLQAVKKAKSYLKYGSFSRQGLIDQLLFEGFTNSQASYGVNRTGL